MLWMTIVLAVICSMAVPQEPNASAQLTPPAEVKKLNFFIGDWQTKGQRVYMMEANPPETSATFRGEWILQGRYLTFTYKSQMMGMDVEGTMLMTYDPTIKKYRAWWFDSMAPMASESTGDFDGSKFVMISKPLKMQGMEIVNRVTFEPKGDSSIYFLLEAKMGGSDSFRKEIEATFTKGKIADSPAGKPAMPPAEVEKLKFLLGKSAGKEKMTYSGQTMEYDATTDAQWALGGLYLRGIYKPKIPGFTDVEGLSMMTYDPASKKYRSWFYSSMDSIIIEAEGTFQGSKLVLDMKSVPMPGSTAGRMIFDSDSSASPNFLMELKNGDKWETIIQATYKKQ